MRLDAFKSAVVLPQGPLHDTAARLGPDRAKLLKGIFGADMLAILETLTNDRLEALVALLTNAKVERATLPLDPAADAREAADACDTFTNRAQALDEGKATKVRDLIAAASTAADTATDTRTQHTAVWPRTPGSPSQIAAQLTAAVAAAAEREGRRRVGGRADTLAREQITAAEQSLDSAS